MSSRSGSGLPRASPIALNLTTMVVVVLMGVALLAHPLRNYRESRRSRLGLQAISAADSVTDARGVTHPLLARDSVTMVLFLDTNCVVCRRAAARYVALRRWAALQRIALRLVSPYPDAAAQFARWGGEEGAFVASTPALYERLGVHVTPTLLFLDSAGVIRARNMDRMPQGVPEYLVLLNRSYQLEGQR